MFIDLIALSIIVSVLSPKKSNLTNPIFSTSSLSNCVSTEDESLSKYIGEKSASDPGAITTPPACFPMFLMPPSNLKDKFMISCTSSSSLMACLSTGCLDIAFSRVIPISKGIILEILSPRLYGFPSALVTSLTTPLAAIVPKVTICDTASLPYFEVTYSITLSLFSMQKSMSKSGIDILSGFKNLSKRRPCLIGSRAVIPKQ